MIAAWHFIQEWAIILSILALTGAVAYAMTILRIPGAVSVAIAGVVIAGAWHWHSSKLNEVSSEYENKIKANSEAWIAKVREADNITHDKEKSFAVAVTTINEGRAKDQSDAKTTLANAVAAAKRNGLYYTDAASTSANACEAKAATVAGVGDDTTQRRLPDHIAEFLISEATRADQIVAESNAVKRLLGAAYKACQ
jgi:hypothetical protein